MNILKNHLVFTTLILVALIDLIAALFFNMNFGATSLTVNLSTLGLALMITPLLLRPKQKLLLLQSDNITNGLMYSCISILVLGLFHTLLNPIITSEAYSTNKTLTEIVAVISLLVVIGACIQLLLSTKEKLTQLSPAQILATEERFNREMIGYSQTPTPENKLTLYSHVKTNHLLAAYALATLNTSIAGVVFCLTLGESSYFYFEIAAMCQLLLMVWFKQRFIKPITVPEAN
ncbi:hypothetical protein TUM4438_39600 [Shewanella sairae]|uniref:DUF1275 domain-containing protein n=1 Tax=Shewanella sairae TaxID=190310 RepID=A0ABQ4PQ54_9GAMM|nr:hypothetical protein [Shewanella sairae]MCL1132082.1 hypothetical protein [Shewanella sairae]GIU51122.1 hypothetical protein TUM4438_39600 [Shewanella sairae]